MDINTYSGLITMILVIHFLADFALQTHEQASLKSTNNEQLFYHVASYSIIWWLVMSCHGTSLKAAIFTGVTFIMHYITDWCTSRISKKYFDEKDFHNGFVVVGFDQLLHYLQLWHTYKILYLTTWTLTR